MQDMNEMIIDEFISGQRKQVDERQAAGPGNRRSTGQGLRNEQSDGNALKKLPTVDEMTAEMVRKAEASKARIYETPGESSLRGGMNHREGNLQVSHVDANSNLVHSVMVDENYLVLGNHIDSITRQKIIEGEYVNFAKLLPKDRVMSAEDHQGQRMEVVNRDGHMYWVLAMDGTKVNNFNK